MDYLHGMLVSDDWQIIAHSSKKHGVAELLGIHARLLASHTAYKGMIDDYHDAVQSSTLTGDEKKILIDFYESPPSALKKLIQERRNDHGLDCCPYCGYPYAPDTLDHFMPKDEWPEFAFLPNNLIPQCRGCAPIKGSFYYCADSASCLFVHPIYSDLISRVRIQISITSVSEYDRPIFAVSCVVGSANAEDLKRVARHLKSVKFKSRVEAYCIREFLHIKRQLKRKAFNIRLFLEAVVNKRSSSDGTSVDWECALYRAILINHPLMSYLGSLKPATVVVIPTVMTEVALED
jgi:hypothetical protein